MIRIEFLDYEVQNAIYTVACNYEKFPIANANDVMKSFWDNVKISNKCGFGLEKAISDFILQQNDFDIENGKYGYLIEEYECEILALKHFD